MKSKPYVYRGVDNKAAVEELEPKPYLYRGVDNEAAVKALQRQLNLFLREKGRKILEDDGDFGKATEAALKSFKSEILRIKKPDGKVADFTHDMLDEHYPLPVKENEREGGYKKGAGPKKSVDGDDAIDVKPQQVSKARPAEKVTKKPSAEASTQDDEPKNKSGSNWNLMSSWIGWFNPTKKETPEAKVKDEPASERGHPVAKPTPAKSVVEPTPEKPTPAKSDRKQPKPEKPKLEKPDINPTPAKRDVNGDSYSRYNSSTGQLADVNDLTQDGPANPIKAASVYVKAGYGMRIHPITKRPEMHTGVDIPEAYGTPVIAAMDGKVTYAARAGGYGNFISIDEPGPLSSHYGHLSKILVANGQTVKKGQVIGLVGSTGRSTGPHLHYEVRYNGVAVNPEHYGLVRRPFRVVEPLQEFLELARAAREDQKNKASQLFSEGKGKPFLEPWNPSEAQSLKQKGEFSPQDAGSNGVPPEGPASTPSTNVKQKGLLSWLGI